jgi:hypothetical protein
MSRISSRNFLLATTLAGLSVAVPHIASAAACPKAPATVPDSPTPKIPKAGKPTPAPDMSGAWPALAAPPSRCPAVALVGAHATYNIGPGKAYTNLTDFPWLNLVAGDVVNIYYSPKPYATKVALRATGTAEKPVVINGVADAHGRLPIITGTNAMTAKDAIAQEFYVNSGGATIEPFGVIVLYRGHNDEYGYKPTHLTIQNLKVTGATPGKYFTNHLGKRTKFPEFTSGIYGVAAQYLTVQNNEIYNNGLGTFINNQNDVAGTSYFITLRGNYLHDNGTTGSYLEHNVYVQGVRSLYEGNYIGQLRAGAQGGSLKDRSSGAVVRYNYIVSAARAIDLVEPQDFSPDTDNDPLRDIAWVYGNVIVDDFNNPGLSSGDLIHWGGDSYVYERYHKGSMYFYNNTVIVKATQAQAYSMSVFDVATVDQTIVAANNIIAHAGTSEMDACYNSSTDGMTLGTLKLVETNWFAPYVSNGKCIVDTASGTLLKGVPKLTTDFHLPAGSKAIGKSVVYPTAGMEFPAPASAANLRVTGQYAPGPNPASPKPSFVARKTATDLGAYAYP